MLSGQMGSKLSGGVQCAHCVPGLGPLGPSPTSLCEGGSRAVNPHGASVWHPSPKIRVSTVCQEVGKEAGHMAVSSLRKLSSGGYHSDHHPSEFT